MSNLETQYHAVIERAIAEHSRPTEHFDYMFGCSVVGNDKGELVTITVLILKLTQLGTEKSNSYYLAHQAPTLGMVYEAAVESINLLGKQFTGEAVQEHPPHAGGTPTSDSTPK